ncbi:MAG: hypothetical protein RL308_3358, partial [Bacteroidota bacterium]
VRFQSFNFYIFNLSIKKNETKKIKRKITGIPY